MSRRGRASRALRLAVGVAATAVLVLVTAVMTLIPAASPRRLVAGALEAGAPSFYAVPVNAPAAPPGTLLRSEELRSAPAGSRAWRVLYHSTDLTGTTPSSPP
jgi:hypothetical protein